MGEKRNCPDCGARLRPEARFCSVCGKIIKEEDNKIELNKLDQKGYTTKGFGHGYGLCLVKKILENNKRLINERKISKELFVQMLKIKM